VHATLHCHCICVLSNHFYDSSKKGSCHNTQCPMSASSIFNCMKLIRGKKKWSKGKITNLLETNSFFVPPTLQFHDIHQVFFRI
jgi:hypothetical protein